MTPDDLLPAPALPAPWRELRPHRQADLRGLVLRLVRHPHVLDRARFVPVAECGRCDLLLLHLDDGRQALVQTADPAVATRIVGGPSAAAAAVRAHVLVHEQDRW